MFPVSHYGSFIGSSLEIMKDVSYWLLHKCGNCCCPLRSKCGEKSCFQLINVVIISYFYRALNAQGADNIWRGAKQIKFLVQSRPSPHIDPIQYQTNNQHKYGTALATAKEGLVGGEMVLGWRKERIPLKYNKIIETLWIGPRASIRVVQTSIFFKEPLTFHFLGRRDKSTPGQLIQWHVGNRAWGEYTDP